MKNTIKNSTKELMLLEKGSTSGKLLSIFQKLEYHQTNLKYYEDELGYSEENLYDFKYQEKHDDYTEEEWKNEIDNFENEVQDYQQKIDNAEYCLKEIKSELLTEIEKNLLVLKSILEDCNNSIQLNFYDKSTKKVFAKENNLEIK
jgi:hypothetical protein